MISSVASRSILRVIAPDHSAVSECASTKEEGWISTLTRRLVKGEEAAWREFHAQYYERLLRYLLVVCRGDEQAAREHLQAALTRIVRHVRPFDQEDAWWSWLTVVTRSC